jgi:cell filamentation protein, protein adenylyltransferase
MTHHKYEATGVQSEFQPGSRSRVLRNLLDITRVRDMNEAESQALQLAQQAAIERFDMEHRFTATDICELHRLWLGPVYAWAGEYRSLNIGKVGFQFAHATLIPKLMAQLQRRVLRRHTPCAGMDDTLLARTLAEVHAELILIHPFRDGNGRLARLLALLMALQAGLPPLDFTPMAGRGKRTYFASVHAALSRDYAPLTEIFVRIIERSRRAVSNKQ